MIAVEKDDRVVGLALRFELIQQVADLGVHDFDVGVDPAQVPARCRAVDQVGRDGQSVVVRHGQRRPLRFGELSLQVAGRSGGVFEAGPKAQVAPPRGPHLTLVGYFHVVDTEKRLAFVLAVGKMSVGAQLVPGRFRWRKLVVGFLVVTRPVAILP